MRACPHHGLEQWLIIHTFYNGSLIKQLAHKVDSMATHNKMLKTQISQVAQQQAATAAPAGTFPAQPQPNPKGHVNAVTLRSGTELDNNPAAVRVRSVGTRVFQKSPIEF